MPNGETIEAASGAGMSAAVDGITAELLDRVYEIDRQPWKYIGGVSPIDLITWGGAVLAQRLHGSHLTPPTEDYNPIRNIDVTPDQIIHTRTDLGVMPGYVYNLEMLGNGENPDLYSHSPLFTRADRGFQAPMIHSLDELVRELGMGMVLFAAPGNSGIQPTPCELNRTSLPGMVKATQQAIENVSEITGRDLTRQIHRGPSLGGYITLGLGDERVSTGAEIEMLIPEAPAGWHLRHHLDPRRSQVAGTIKQFWPLLGPEVAHVISSAHDIRVREGSEQHEKYLQTLGQSAPMAEAVLTYLKLTAGFLTIGDHDGSGSLEDIIRNIPRETKIRALAFTEDFVTLPHVLSKHLLALGYFDDVILNEVIGAHTSLKSMRKTFREHTEIAIRSHCDPSYRA